MKAIILATSETAHLHPLSEHIPSPMLPLVNRPVMEYAIEWLARAGVKQIVVTLHHLGGSIESYFGDGRRWGVQIKYLLQKEPRGSAGALKWAANELTETFLALPGDALIEFDLDAACVFHRAENATATRIVCDARATGAYLFEPRALDAIPARTLFDIAIQLLPALTPVRDFAITGEWCALDSFAQYQDAQRAQLERATRVPGRQIAPGIWVGRNPAIHPTAALAAPVCIGDDCFIGSRAEIGPNAVLGANVFVDDEATIHNSTILDRTYVGKLVHLADRVVDRTLIVDPLTGQGARVVDRFLLAANTPESIGSGLRRASDFLIALALSVIALPIAIVIGLLAWIGARGKLFARKARIGSHGEAADNSTTFDLVHFATRADSRIGAWLERWELNRLPELWNVLRGDLNLVGVKPLTRAEMNLITEEWQRQRFASRAGLTGLWYIQTARAATLDDVLIADAYYCATRTGRDDLRVLWQTPGAWWRRAMS
jgi:NDP-sugar pyrophosphorylase family protein